MQQSEAFAYSEHLLALLRTLHAWLLLLDMLGSLGHGKITASAGLALLGSAACFCMMLACSCSTA